ncbi:MULTISPECIES: DUF3429 domain-containing protein [Rhizobium]|uniref:DUF3429 domain-containing protein n=1 Tax=Rhizobium TaxID=379 RepID=UPI0015CF7103|nr:MULTISPECIES: DUF3429 domain-containing protein [Rhizobium]MBY4593423.1 DUF3429 domain-containing protein [Rhizobium redzepovicii]ULJ81708.1 DUF3429 domain-containing protein [Rhizobium sp. C104]
MKSDQRVVSIVLTYLGALPFWLLILASVAAPQIEAQRAFIIYGAIIGSFMAGTLWGSIQNGRHDVLVVVSSNVLALVAFATLLIGSTTVSLLTQMISFGLLLAADARIIAEHDDLGWYLKLRVRVTLVVLFAFCLMFALHWAG